MTDMGGAQARTATRHGTRVPTPCAFVLIALL